MKHMTEEYKWTIRAHDGKGTWKDPKRLFHLRWILEDRHISRERKRKDHPNGGGSECKGEKGKWQFIWGVQWVAAV